MTKQRHLKSRRRGGKYHGFSEINITDEVIF